MSRYHPRYQSRSSKYTRGQIPRNFAELAKAVPIDLKMLCATELECHTWFVFQFIVCELDSDYHHPWSFPRFLIADAFYVKSDNF